MSNSAERLHSILSVLAAQPDHIPLHEAWSKALLTEQRLEIFRRLGKLADLVDAVRKEVNGLERVDHSLFLNWIRPIEQLLGYTNLDQTVAHVKQCIRPEILVRLEFCAERLSAQIGTTRIPDEEMICISQMIEDLFAALKDSKLPRKVREPLLDLTEALRRAVNEYFIRGASGLRKEMYSILATVERHTENLPLNSEQSEVKAFWSIMQKLDTVTSVAGNVRAILENGDKLLLLLPPAIDALVK